jgi:hypothetical protein
MTDRTRREHIVRRIATIGAVVTAFAVAPAIAAAGNNPAVAHTQVSTQLIGVQTPKVQRAQAAVSVQRHLVQVAQSRRITMVLRGQLR